MERIVLGKSAITSLFHKAYTLTRVLSQEGLNKGWDLILLKVDTFLGEIIEKKGNIGNLDGCTFSVDSSAIPTKVKGLFFFNRYEGPERKAIARFLDPTLPVVELGGAIGVVGCTTNKRLTSPHHHVVVEPNTDLTDLLTQNRDRNGCEFAIITKAVSYGSAATTFYRSSNYLGSSLHIPQGLPIQIETTNLKQILSQYGFETCTLVCDIEGSEAELVSQESEVLRRRVKTLVLEIHDWVIGREATESLHAHLKTIGFRRVYHKKYNHVFQNTAF